MFEFSHQLNRWNITTRRLTFGLLTGALVFVIAWQAFAMLRINGLNALKLGMFAIFVILLVPMVLSFWTALIGFVIRLCAGDPLRLTRTPAEPPYSDLPRTAVVMPAYNEDPTRLLAGLASMYQSLEETRCLASFDFFLLSDTSDPDVWVREEVGFAELRESVADPERLHYRNRRENHERKTGNIAEFCSHWGNRFRYMVVLDADSIMTGRSLLDLVQLMEKNPQAGIVQGPPFPVNRGTLFGRLQQFATQAYSSIFITGLNFWQGGAANYWGHNAIIRIQPFIEHCRLPALPGKEPLGGQILSHDFVEAAFLRRAGWKVYLASELQGCYEEVPPSLITYAARDRRWCQGNLQHSRLLLAPGLHSINRLHLSLGVLSYLSSPLWLLLLLLSTLEAFCETHFKHPYFPPAGQSLFPTWRISVEQQAVLLFCLVMTLLLLPKILSLILNLFDARRVKQFGGPLKLAGSVFLEMLFSTLLAPNFALLQTRFVAGILAGKKVRWDSQERGEIGTSFAEAVRRHWPATLLGISWCGLLLYVAPKVLLWFSPVLAGLILSVPLSAWTSRTGAGLWAKSHGLFLTPEEVEPPDILTRFAYKFNEMASRPWATPRDGLSWIMEDGQVADVHLTLMPKEQGPPSPLQQHHLEGLRLKLSHGGIGTLTREEKRALLLDVESVRMLRQQPELSQPMPASQVISARNRM